MLSIESDITKTLDFKMILKNFAQKSLFLKGPCINSLSVIVFTCNTKIKTFILFLNFSRSSN